MATHAHSTRTPLLPLSRSAPPLLGQGLGRQVGPVTQAIRAMRAAEPRVFGQLVQKATQPAQVSAQVGPKASEFSTACRKLAQPAPLSADHAIAAIRDGLASFFADADRQRVRELRRRLADRIEADLALLDALDGDPDAEPSLGSIDAASHSNFMTQEVWNLGGGQDREAGDDNGIADWQGESEQRARHRMLDAGGAL